MRRGLTRSSPYVDKIKEIFRSNGMPEDLAYLPHVESSFNPKAYSKAGAAGIWQFTRSTGKKFMKVGRGIDERRDPIRSSKAAAQLLEQNYKILRSWPLAITAYNHGIAGLSKRKKNEGKRGSHLFRLQYPAVQIRFEELLFRIPRRQARRNQLCTVFWPYRGKPLQNRSGFNRREFLGLCLLPSGQPSLSSGTPSAQPRFETSPPRITKYRSS